MQKEYENIILENNKVYKFTNENGVEIELCFWDSLKLKILVDNQPLFESSFQVRQPFIKKPIQKEEIVKVGKLTEECHSYVFVNGSGHLCKVVKYNHANDVRVLFEGYDTEVKSSWTSCKNGTVKVPSEVQKKDRIGQRFQNNEGYWYEIVDYISSTEVYIKFDEQEEVFKYTYGYASSGNVKNPYHPNVFGVGYIGVGEYSSKDENGNQAKEYRDWSQILHRCYYEPYVEQRPRYQQVEICEEWRNYQNFAKWHRENYYEVEGEKMALDKDLFSVGTPFYSPEFCVFLPTRINNALANKESFNDKVSYFIDMIEYYRGKIPQRVISQLESMVESWI